MVGLVHGAQQLEEGYKRRLRFENDLAIKLKEAQPGGPNRTPGPNFMRGLRARIKAGGPQGSAADRAQLKSNPPPRYLTARQSFIRKKKKKVGVYA